MKNLLPFLVLLIACTQKPVDTADKKPTDLAAQSRQEIWDTDIAMSDMAVKEGFNKTLLAFADDSIVKPKEGEFPVIGKKALEEYWAGDEDTQAISWKPFKAEAAKSGEMGYTLGNWTFVTPDSTYYGNYYTFWKKQPDGKWKWVVDGGNNTPVPGK